VDTWTIIAGVGVIVGIIAGVVQVLDYPQERRKKREETAQEGPPSSFPPIPEIPHNLPSRTEFIGREAEKARVHEALCSRYPLTGIDGIGGIGKTVLALEVAHECLHASQGNAPNAPTDGIATFDGFIWTTAKDRDLTLNALLDAVARTLDYPGIAQQPVEDKRIAVRKLLQGKPHLLIVDNFETITDETVRDFLLDLPEPSKALITTREQKLRRVWAISLKGMKEPEALALIRNEGKRLGLASLERAENHVLLHLYQATGGAPLAIKWAVGQIKQRGQSLDTVLTALHEARGDIFDNIFARSWNLLSTDTRQVLIVMPLFATSASREAIEAASDVHHFALDEALGQLVEMSLIDATDDLDITQRRYSVHPLTRAFATAKLRDEPGHQNAIRHRLVRFFEKFTEKHGGYWNQQGFIQLEPELPNILSIMQWCWRQQLAHPATDTLYNIADFMLIRGYWNETMALGQRAIEVTSQRGDDLTAAYLRVWPIGWLHRHRGNLDLAEDEVTRALVTAEQFGEEKLAALAKRNLGRIAQERGQLDQAEQLLRETLEFYRSGDDERNIYFVTANLADVKLEQGAPDVARALCKDVLESAHQFDDPERLAHLLNVLGRVAYRRGNLRKAKELWEEALSHMERANRLDEIADALLRLAQIEIQKGRDRTARHMLSDALDTYRRLDMPFRIREVETLLAKLRESTDHKPQSNRNQSDD